MNQKSPNSGLGKSASQVDQLREKELQSSIFRKDGAEDRRRPKDVAELRNLLRQQLDIPQGDAEKALRHIEDHLDALGLKDPDPALLGSWLAALLREQGLDVPHGLLHSLELSLGDVERNIFHPVGLGAGADQNPEATSQRIAQRIKSQFAAKKVYQKDVIAAHDEGRLALLHLGAVDRPHDMFLTPDYLKTGGLPASSSAPAAGPARYAHVLLAHMIRFTHECQNHFAGDVRWGYANTLLLPFLEGMGERDLAQFAQQMLYEFAQLDVARGGLYRKVILDFDFDMPRQLADLPARGVGGEYTGKTYRELNRTLQAFNHVLMDILSRGDIRSNPFHSPRIVFHFNQPGQPWTSRHQKLLETAFFRGNPRLAFSYQSRDFGALGQIRLNDPDFLALIREPSSLRGFTSSTIALNLPRLAHGSSEEELPAEFGKLLDIAVSAHRQKRLFIARLMAFGNRGPLSFLRHKVGERPFLKVDDARQPMQIIGLGETAAYLNRAPNTAPGPLGKMSARVLHTLQQALAGANRHHKLGMFLTGTESESVAYRFAFQDLRDFGQHYAPFVLRRPNQSHPIYGESANILAFKPMHWRERMEIEGALHPHFHGATHLFFLDQSTEDAAFYQRIYQTAIQTGCGQIQPAPDMTQCASCGTIHSGKLDGHCTKCGSHLLTDYGFCQANFSAVDGWCLGKRSEWKIRHRADHQPGVVQSALPL